MNIKDQRVIIHTGPGKTGSSAIQAWLTNNKEILADNGVFYPSHPLSKSQISSGNLRAILSEVAGKGEVKTRTSWVADPQKIVLLLKEFYASSHRILLLSSEFFHHRIVEIQAFIPEAEFISYIRNPIELLESNYNQGIKRHGDTKKFIPPKTLDKYFWQYLSDVFEKVSSDKIILRPYDESLMVNGNIISDLLSVIGIDKAVENTRVNPSFTLTSLEFKRLLNHFDLRALEPRVDAILQSCDVGKSAYSLMDKGDFARLNHHSCQAMMIFVEKYEQEHLLPLLEIFQNMQQKEPMQQSVRGEEIALVCEYLKKQDCVLFKQLKELVGIHNNLLIDNASIYGVFDVEPVPGNILVAEEEKLISCFESFNILKVKHSMVAYELSKYFDLIKDQKYALMFAKVACSLPGKKPEVEQHLNKLLIENNIQLNYLPNFVCKQTLVSKILSPLKYVKVFLTAKIT